MTFGHPPSNSVRLTSVSEERMARLRGGQMLRGWPEDAVIVRVGRSIERVGVTLQIWSSSFDDVAVGESPVWQVAEPPA